MSRELTVNDVRKRFKGCRYQDMAASDVFSLYKNFKSLKPQEPKPFVHPNGSKEICVSVSGTIPVPIGGQQYNIPVCLWLRPTHPYASPLVYVTPTHDMGVQPSKYVDSSGKVYLPYITDWKQGSSDLSTLVQIMCATFVEQCPVYSKAAHRSAQRTSSATYAVQPPPQNPGTSYRQPVYPPRGMPQPQSQPQAYGQQQYAPYPQGPPAMPTPPAQSGYRPTPAANTAAYYPTNATPYPPSSGYQTANPSHMPAPHYQPQIPAASIAATTAASAAAATMSADDELKQIREQELIKRNSLESAVEDKVRRQVKQVLNAAQVEMEVMLQTQEDLKQGNQKINAMLQEMETKTREVDTSIETLHSKNAELESMLDYLRAQPEKIDIDEAVTATSPIYNQILQLYAEENAVDDTIYYLGEALRKGVIELEVFLKHVRELSRQQFMARATIMKARSTAGLPDYGVVA